MISDMDVHLALAYEKAFCRELEKRGISVDGIRQEGVFPAVFAKRVCDRLTSQRNGGSGRPVPWREDMVGIPRDSHLELPDDVRYVFAWVTDRYLDLGRVPSVEVCASLGCLACIISIDVGDDPLTVTMPRFAWAELPSFVVPDWDECWRPQ